MYNYVQNSFDSVLDWRMQVFRLMPTGRRPKFMFLWNVDTATFRSNFHILLYGTCRCFAAGHFSLIHFVPSRMLPFPWPSFPSLLLLSLSVVCAQIEKKSRILECRIRVPVCATVPCIPYWETIERMVLFEVSSMILEDLMWFAVNCCERSLIPQHQPYVLFDKVYARIAIRTKSLYRRATYFARNP